MLILHVKQIILHLVDYIFAFLTRFFSCRVSHSSFYGRTGVVQPCSYRATILQRLASTLIKHIWKSHKSSHKSHFRITLKKGNLKQVLIFHGKHIYTTCSVIWVFNISEGSCWQRSWKHRWSEKAYYISFICTFHNIFHLYHHDSYHEMKWNDMKDQVEWTVLGQNFLGSAVWMYTTYI